MAGNKPKIDWHDIKDPDTINVLTRVEGWARDGLGNKDIATNLGYNINYFSTLVNKHSELSKVLKKGRQPLEVIVEGALYRRAIGGAVVKTRIKKYLEYKCECGGNRNCELCGGLGVIVSDTVAVVQETESTLPADVGAAAFWLKQKKADIWNKLPHTKDNTEALQSIEPPVIVFVK